MLTSSLSAVLCSPVSPSTRVTRTSSPIRCDNRSIPRPRDSLLFAHQVSDAVVDACFAQDPKSRVACETCTGTNFVMVFGEITTKANVDFEQVRPRTLPLAIARNVPRASEGYSAGRKCANETIDAAKSRTTPTHRPRSHRGSLTLF